MDFDVNLTAGLVAGVAAMVPGAVIYSPGVLGRRWMKEIGIKEPNRNDPEVKKAGNKAVSQMLVVSLINGLVASLVVNLAGATTLGESLAVCLLLGYFLVSASAMLVFFEQRSWTWFNISALSHILTAGVIGVVLGLFL